jgi:hypothetical protein
LSIYLISAICPTYKFIITYIKRNKIYFFNFYLISGIYFTFKFIILHIRRNIIRMFLVFFKCRPKSMQYFLKNMSKYFRFKKKCLNDFRIFSNIKKIIFFIFYFFKVLFGKNSFFFVIKLPKIALTGCLLNTPLNLKTL